MSGKRKKVKTKLVYSKVRTFIFVIVGLITLIPFFFLKDASFPFCDDPCHTDSYRVTFLLENQDRGLHGRLLRCIRVNYRAGFLFERVGYLVSLSIVMRI